MEFSCLQLAILTENLCALMAISELMFQSEFHVRTICSVTFQWRRMNTVALKDCIQRDTSKTMRVMEEAL